MLRRVGMAGLLLAGIMMLVSGVGWQEPALAAGPQYDPTFLHGIDLDLVQRVRDCEPSVFAKQQCSLWGHWRPL